MGIEIEYIDEPKLEFGDYFVHEDTKTGLSEYGPFGQNILGLHPSEIKLGFIGTRDSISRAKEWIERCGSYIESENVKIITENVDISENNLFGQHSFPQSTILKRLNKIINRDFVGFNKESAFKSCFQMNPRWERNINDRNISEALATEDEKDRIWKIVKLIETDISSISETGPTPDIIVIALTPEIEEQASEVQVAGSLYLNLRRAIKACAMNQKNPIPVQLLRSRTLDGKSGIQEIATRAWNFCTAQYYKARGVPWRTTTLEEDCCYIGISFFISDIGQNIPTMRSSLALAFDFLGQGLILRGDQFEWNSDALGPSPHLTTEMAHKLIRGTLDEYIKIRKVPPKRVVVHKTSEFWGKDRGCYNELDGFLEGIDDRSYANVMNKGFR